MIDTKDLPSYIPGYEEYCEANSKVPYEDYSKLEDKIDIYETAIDEIETIIADPQDYLYDFQCIKEVIEDMRKEL